jgi:16S rRNA (uracil1498-N3)-methyltransferase
MRIRRFRVPSLRSVAAGETIELPPDQARHARVLRLQPGAKVEVFDGQQIAEGQIESERGTVRVTAIRKGVSNKIALQLAVPWPKGKRAATLIEKCTELEVDDFFAVQCDRSVVTKGEESEGVARLKRIADEAAKQSGRFDAPQIHPQRRLDEVLEGLSQDTCALYLDPTAEIWISQALEETFEKDRHSAVLLITGPEGGFSEREMELLERRGVMGVRVAHFVLRVETAAMAGSAVTRAILSAKGAESQGT